MSLLAAALLLVRRLPDVAFAWSLRLGLAIALIGMGVALFMTSPTPAQLAPLSAGGSLTTIGAHSVGVPDGGPGLPIVGWSTVGGDLRVPHFVGLHALQVLPVIGWLLSRFTGFDTSHRLALIWTAGLSYLGLVMALTWQALRGQSLIAPDAAMFVVWGSLLGVGLLAAAGSILHSTRSSRLPAASLAAQMP
ncbi:MAG: hypothetical protein ACR2IK_18380 [Chloroflexota bacterium]